MNYFIRQLAAIPPAPGSPLPGRRSRHHFGRPAGPLPVAWPAHPTPESLPSWTSCCYSCSFRALRLPLVVSRSLWHVLNRLRMARVPCSAAGPSPAAVPMHAAVAAHSCDCAASFLSLSAADPLHLISAKRRRSDGRHFGQNKPAEWGCRGGTGLFPPAS